MRRFSSLFLALLLPFAAAQTITTTNALGQTIVEVITLDLDGDPTTSIVATVLPTALTTTVTTTDPAGQTVVEVINNDGLGDIVTQTIQTIPPAAPPVAPPAGPVGQPGETPGAAGAVTPFTYTTTDANGNTIATVATFTPSFATTIMPSATFKATVLDYSQYTASYATHQPANNANTNGASQRRSSSWWAVGLSATISLVGGAILLLGA